MAKYNFCFKDLFHIASLHIAQYTITIQTQTIIVMRV